MRVAGLLLVLLIADAVQAESFDEWRHSLAGHIRCHLVYPNGPGRPTARRTAYVSFKIGADGRLSDVNIERSSGVLVFDRAALAAVETASPAPPPPGLPDGVPLTVHVPLAFDPPGPAAAMPGAEPPRSEPPKPEPPICRDVGIM